MSWLFSQALVEAYSADTCSDGAQSAPSSGNPTPQAFLSPDKMTAFLRPSRSGMTFRPLTDGLGAAVLTWCQAASRARTSAWPAREQASTASDPACGDTWRGSLARFDPATSSWRTAQPSLLEDLGESSVIWPRSGMTAAGQCWELPMLEHRTSGTGSGLSVPTPTVYDSTGKGTPRKDSNLDQGGRHGVSLHHFVAKWPTPTTMRGITKEAAEKEWDRKGSADLRMAVHLWPTPKASENDRNTPTLAAQVGGSLNPTWVEWLMGWPLGWTDLRPLAMGKSPFAPQQHSNY